MTTPERRQVPTLWPPVGWSVSAGGPDMREVLSCVDIYQKTASARARCQVVEAAQRAVRHERQKSPSGLDLPAVVTRSTTDIGIQTEPTKHLQSLTSDTSSQQPNSHLNLANSIISPTPQTGNGQTLSSVTHPPPSTGTKEFLPVTWSDRKCITHKTTNDSQIPPIVSTTDQTTGQTKNFTHSTCFVNESLIRKSITRQNNYRYTHNNNDHAGVVDRAAVSDVDNKGSTNHVPGGRIMKRVNFRPECLNSSPIDSSCFLHQGLPSTPLYFATLQDMRWKIATGQIDRRAYMIRGIHRPATVSYARLAPGIFHHEHFRS